MSSTLVHIPDAFGLDTEIGIVRALIERRLGELVPGADLAPERLNSAVRYSLLAPGKRIRPVVTMLTARHLGGDADLALDPACAIEMVHTASLILDDMPAMDDATLRRGRRANHLVYGEDIALLAAMALLNGAYGVVGSAPGLSAELRVELVNMLSAAIGHDGIIGGQESDLRTDWRGQDEHGLREMHLQKTGALFIAAAEAGARLAGLSDTRVDAVRRFARHLGLAFQTLDDLLDASAGEREAGKDVGQDTGKPTFVAYMGQDGARRMAEQLLADAAAELAPLGSAAEPLAELAFSFCMAGGGSAGVRRTAS